MKPSAGMVETAAYLLLLVAVIAVIGCALAVGAAVEGPLGVMAGLVVAVGAVELLRRPLGDVLQRLLARR